MSDQAKQVPVSLESLNEKYESYVKGTIGEYEYDLRVKFGLNKLTEVFESMEDLVDHLHGSTIVDYLNGSEVTVNKKDMLAAILVADIEETIEALDLANGVLDLDLESFVLYNKMSQQEGFSTLQNDILSKARDELDESAVLKIAHKAANYDGQESINLDELVNKLAPSIDVADINAVNDYLVFLKDTLSAKDQLKDFISIMKKQDNESLMTAYDEEAEEEEEEE